MGKSVSEDEELLEVSSEMWVHMFTDLPQCLIPLLSLAQT